MKNVRTGGTASLLQREGVALHVQMLDETLDTKRASCKLVQRLAVGGHSATVKAEGGEELDAKPVTKRLVLKLRKIDGAPNDARVVKRDSWQL